MPSAPASRHGGERRAGGTRTKRVGAAGLHADDGVLHLRAAQRGVLEVDPDEVEVPAEQLRARGAGQREHRADAHARSLAGERLRVDATSRGYAPGEHVEHGIGRAARHLRDGPLADARRCAG